MYDGQGNYLTTLYYVYLSMNWGTYGEGDGFYVYNYFNPNIPDMGGVQNFNNYNEMLYNIGHN